MKKALLFYGKIYHVFNPTTIGGRYIYLQYCSLELFGNGQMQNALAFVGLQNELTHLNKPTPTFSRSLFINETFLKDTRTL